MPLRPCLCGCGQIVTGSRCQASQREQQRAKRQRRPYTYAEQQRRAAAVQAHVTAHGWTCPGWQRSPHPSRDLTADHVQPYATTRTEDGPLAVLCRPCNSAKGARTEEEHP